MILQIVDNTIRPEMADAYMTAAKAFAADSSANDAGCLKMEVMTRAGQPGHVYIVPAWATEEARPASPTFLTYTAHLKPAHLGPQTPILRHRTPH